MDDNMREKLRTLFNDNVTVNDTVRSYLNRFINICIFIYNGSWVYQMSPLSLFQHGHNFGFSNHFITNIGLSLKNPYFPFVFNNLDYKLQLISGNNGFSKSRVVYADEQYRTLHARKGLEGKNTTCLGHGFNDKDTGHYGHPRKMPRKKWLIKGNIFNAHYTL